MNKGDIKSRLFIILQILLFLTWPFVAFYTNNLGQYPSIKSLSIIFFVFLLGTIFLILIIKFIIPKISLFRFSNIICLFIFCLFQYLSIRTYFQQKNILTYNYIWFFFTLAICLLGWIITRKFKINYFLFFVILSFFIPPLFKIISFTYKKNKSSSLHVVKESRNKKFIKKPNIYYIILDGYARDDVLLKQYSYDNSQFLNKLKELGFYIANKSYANYPLTYLSLASSLSMSYIIKEGNDILTSRSPFYPYLQGNNQFVDNIKNEGYTYIHFENGLWTGSDCGTKVNYCLRNFDSKKDWWKINLNETEITFLKLTPLYIVLRKINTVFDSYYRKSFQIPNAMVSIGRWLENNKNLSKKPHFLFAHTLPPHPPYFYNSDCSYRNKPHESLTDKNKDLYLTQLNCLNKEVYNLLKNIIKFDKNPIIILQSDHGAANTDPFSLPLKKWTSEIIQERFSILNAFRVPTECKKWLYPSISPVNNLKIILSCLSNEKPLLLEDKSYFATYEKSPDYGKVVEVYP